MTNVKIASNPEYIENRQASGVIQYTGNEGDLVGIDPGTSDLYQADASASADYTGDGAVDGPLPAAGVLMGPARDPANYGNDFAETALVVESNYDLVGEDRKTFFEFGIRVRNNDEDWGFAPGEPVYLDKGGGFTQDLSLHGAGDIKQVLGYAKDSGEEVAIAVQPAEEIAHGEGVMSGDGTTTVFTFPHGLSYTPSNVRLTPQSNAASGGHYISNVTATDVEVTFTAAPSSGTDNIVFDWEAHE